MKKNILSLWALLLTLVVNAQMMNPVHFTSQLKTGKGAEAEIIFHATIDQGWHVYSTDIGDNGPIEASFNVTKMEGAELVGKLTPRGNVIKKMDKVFNMELKYFENEATFVQKIRFTKPDYDIDCYLEYGTCSDESCLPPSEAAFKQSGKSPTEIVNSEQLIVNSKNGDEKAEKEETPPTETIATVPSDTTTSDTAAVANSSLFTLHSSLFTRHRPLVPRHLGIADLRFLLRPRLPLPPLAPPHGLRSRPPGRLHALHLAHHPHDRQLLPKTRQGR